MTLAAKELSDQQIDQPEEKTTLEDVWLEVGYIAENITLYVNCQKPSVQLVNTIVYEAEELVDKIKKVKEGIK